MICSLLFNRKSEDRANTLTPYHCKFLTVGAVYHLEPEQLNTNVNMECSCNLRWFQESRKFRARKCTAIATVMKPNLTKSKFNLNLS